MKLIQELLALREDPHEYSEVFKDADYWLDGSSNLESADIEVFYEYEGASHTDHPYGMGWAREHHAAQVTVTSVKLVKDASVYDDDGDKVVDVMKKGTELLDQPWWKDKWTESLADEIHDRVEKSEPDFDEPDHYDSRY